MLVRGRHGGDPAAGRTIDVNVELPGCAEAFANVHSSSGNRVNYEFVPKGLCSWLKDAVAVNLGEHRFAYVPLNTEPVERIALKRPLRLGKRSCSVRLVRLLRQLNHEQSHLSIRIDTA